MAQASFTWSTPVEDSLKWVAEVITNELFGFYFYKRLKTQDCVKLDPDAFRAAFQEYTSGLTDVPDSEEVETLLDTVVERTAHPAQLTWVLQEQLAQLDFDWVEDFNVADFVTQYDMTMSSDAYTEACSFLDCVLRTLGNTQISYQTV